MFKKTKGRIVGAIAASLILFMITILVVVYLSSYYGARNDNREMLKRHVTEFGEGGEGPEGRPAPPDGEMRPPDDERRRDEGAFRLATFYTVVIDENGGVTVDNGNSSVMSDEELVEAAKEAAAFCKDLVSCISSARFMISISCSSVLRMIKAHPFQCFFKCLSASFCQIIYLFLCLAHDMGRFICIHFLEVYQIKYLSVTRRKRFKSLIQFVILLLPENLEFRCFVIAVRGVFRLRFLEHLLH